MIPEYWDRAVVELSERDEVLRKLISGRPGISLKSRGDAFQTLARSIAGQQISVKAADSVWKKISQRMPEITPLAVTACTEHELRECGLSIRKAQYLLDLARRFTSGALGESLWLRLDDEALIAELMKVKGIGRWTAEMFLLFHLTRPNIFPVDDIGLQRAMSIQYNNAKPMSKLKMRAIAEHWLPWRSVATWYLWRSLEPIPVEY
jgi:DNA-3-methyladenine glycosylase II